MTEPDEVKEMLRRFENEIDLSDSKDSDDIIRKFGYFQNRDASLKQEILLRKWSKEKGLAIKKPRGISEKKAIPREKLKARYLPIKQRTKKGYYYRVQPRDTKTGRYVKR